MRKIVVLILMVFSILSCSDTDDNNFNENDFKVIVDAEEYANISFEDFTINSVEVIDNHLKVKITASGWCDEDSWEIKLVDSEAILESFPVQRRLKVSLEKENVCLAILTKEFSFDISDLQVEGYNKVRLNIMNFDTQVLYQYGADDAASNRLLITDGVDVDDDGVLDFKLEDYEIATADVPSSAGIRHLLFESLNNSQFLYKENERNLFLETGDIIRSEVGEGFLWTTNSTELISKTRIFDVYDEFWSVQSDLTEDYYLGVKRVNQNEEKIGWLKLEFDLITGDIYLVDKVLTEADELSI